MEYNIDRFSGTHVPVLSSCRLIINIKINLWENEASTAYGVNDGWQNYHNVILEKYKFGFNVATF